MIQELQVFKEYRVLSVILEHRGSRDYKEMLALLAFKVCRGYREPSEIQDHREHKA